MTSNVAQFPPLPRAVRPVPDPLGLYLRISRNDHRELLDFLAAGRGTCFGAVFDPTTLERHKELRALILDRELDAILDPRTQPSATAGGYTDSLGSLPWGVGKPHELNDFKGLSGRRLMAALGDFVLEHGFTQVLAPTHILRTSDDPWLTVDADMTVRLRSYLDRNGGARMPIIYSLALPYSAFRDREKRRAVLQTLKTLPIAALWLKVENFGSDSGPTAVQTYISAAEEFHQLSTPIVADHVGGAAGLALLAFGATGGLAHGITFGERFAVPHWHRPPTGSGFQPQRRIYVPAIDAMLKRNDAKALIDSSSRSRVMFACSDTRCCPRGVRDMLENPGRHFLYQRIGEVSRLSQIPEEFRPQRFLDQHLRPMTDKAVAATTINWEDPRMAKKMHENRRRVDSLRIALGQHAEDNPPQSFAAVPMTRSVRDGR
jgi:hypothetical protein